MTDEDYYRRFESWAVNQTGAKPCTTTDVFDMAATGGHRGGSPRWCQPGKCWRDDRRTIRTYATASADTDLREWDSADDPADLDHPEESSPSTLLGLFVETARVGADGRRVRGYGYEKAGNSDQLTVCRNCGVDLGLPRDIHANVVRPSGGRQQYCTDQCRAKADNRRDRQRRAGGKFPTDDRGWYTPRPKFSLRAITVSGAAALTSPGEWNRVTPRNRPDRHRPRAGNRRDVFALTMHEFVTQRREGHTPHPMVHRYRDSVSRLPGHSRLGPPWKVPSVWRITRLGSAAASK